MLSGRVTKIPSLFPQLSKDEGLRDTGHIMSNGNLILGVNSVAVSYLIHYDGLLQNAADMITKCDSYFITKCVRFLLQNGTVLLQNVTVTTNGNNFITNAMFITNCDSTISTGSL